MTLPNFLHIGAAKAASSWLWNVCKEHPDIYVPESPDNVNFFTVHYQRGLDWYSRTYFDSFAGERAIGEFSNSYMVFAPALERIAKELPDIRLTLTLRNPVERAFLNWAHLHLKNKPSGLDMRRNIGIPFDRVLHHHGHSWFRLWIEPGFYARHLKFIYSIFPEERVLVTLYDDLASDAKTYLQDYFRFLGVDAAFESSLARSDINPDTRDSGIDEWVSKETRNELRQVYREDVDQLEELLDRDLSRWK